MKDWLRVTEALSLKRVFAKDVTKRVRWVDEIKVIGEKRKREEKVRGMSRFGGCWRFVTALCRSSSKHCSKW